jgi:hypothetical protein
MPAFAGRTHFSTNFILDKEVRPLAAQATLDPDGAPRTIPEETLPRIDNQNRSLIQFPFPSIVDALHLPLFRQFLAN